ncbi:uncharacterized protein LOC117232989 [Bombus vosnesenskii]|uniref:Uncharacterized protein LOC117232989 n=1 Tax=Bombus vosnesenskii TaxID=207650 RepID=A0A6J3K6L7_9HYME|nr:uncharacterized protein LOC117232989 [Bombus vosnesenskii]
MAQAESLSTLRRRRGVLDRRLATIRRELDEYEASGKANRIFLASCRSSFDELWRRILEVQEELGVEDEREGARVDSLSQEHRELDMRFRELFEQISATTPSTTTTGETCRKPEPTTVPEVRVLQFDGALENWTYFYDTFSSIVDRNEGLTNVQKFQHLRSSITGRAAQSIQSLELTEANYPIALDTLKDKFNCPLQICMHHWNLMRNYPEIKKETPEALEDLLKTISVNLKALENLKQPVTSNIAIIELLASKLPSSSLRKWQRTLPRQQVPSYQHLIDFLKTRANGTQLLFKAKESKGSTHKHHSQRTTIPHGRTFATTSRTLVCPTCNGPHELRHCKIFKAKSATKRFQIVRKASLCINCLGRGHSPTQCTSGSSKAAAMSRLASLHRRFQRDKQYETAYSAVIQEYLDVGHMTKINTDHATDHGYYLPHHGVIKESSDTTKLRVVFDGSASSTTGVSLNDALHTGPKLQEDLRNILLRFRSFQYVLTGDIEKMYRQFILRPEDRPYQKILWRVDNGEIETYRLNTVTFGLSAAPYLAIRCLKQLAEDEGPRFPRAAQILRRDFYVDDALTGADTKDEALSVRNDLTKLLKLAGLNIRKWASHDRDLLRGLPEEDTNQKLHLGESSTLKTLGVLWDSADDAILYSVKTNSDTSRITKRSISSVIAQIYDPLGLLAPVIVRAKMILQQVWTLKVDWDESLPTDVHTEWIKYHTQLPLLNAVRFPRKTILESATKIELHGFCDASERAYGACVYVRTTDRKNNIWTRLLTARSKVAPLKSLSIPRLELSGALILTSLISSIQQALTTKISRIVYWTDSTIVLHWIRSSPHTLKTFVANRVAEIQTKTNISDWRHVPTDDNPADLISRGQTPKEFLCPSIWKNGPRWLLQSESYWPVWSPTPVVDLPEQKKTICLRTSVNDNTLLHRYSSWPRLIRIVARCLRWRHKQHRTAHLTTDELTAAHNRLIKILQSHHFAPEIRILQKNRSEDVGGKLQPLNPFHDEDGLLRVGGRLTNSAIPFSQKHPIILPKSPVTELIIEQEHRNNHHTGTQATLYAMRLRYWPIDGRSQVWRTLRRCVRCCRANPPPVEYLMGDLPEARITESRPFTNVGIDYCGPFYIKERRDRNRRKIETYAAIFVCLATKAVHIELVSDLTTDAFLAALRRFISRRRHCATILTDNGTNFVGANRELQELRTLLQSDDHQDRIQNFLADRQIQWRFNPPNSPHFGGLWEVAVKAFKRHLIRVVGTELLTFEHLNTLVIEIEAILNSRPLTPISSDPKDPPVLTPGHFLIGDTLTSLRERDFRTVPSGRLSSWQRIHQIKQHFWSRWYREYLNELTRRSKWDKGKHNIHEGTVVILRKDNVPSMQWPLGRVIKVHPGADGIIRTATVQTATSILDRGVKRLVPLPIHPDPDEAERPHGAKEVTNDTPDSTARI